jgi:SAM-dependent methyltransferase
MLDCKCRVLVQWYVFLLVQTLNSMADAQTSSDGPQDSRSPLDLTLFADGLQRHPDGIWRGRGAEPVSYPTAGNSDCFAVEDDSFWFAHRNKCLIALLQRFPVNGSLFDIGGGNGFVAAALQSKGGLSVVVVEPGADGVRHAKGRGLRTVVQATLKAARFRDGSLPAVGFFDVMEHIQDEQGFLGEVRRCLAIVGRIYLTVPAGRWLWSDADVQAGHFRRYTFASLRRALECAGFRPLFMSKFFSPLPLPLFLSRTLPSFFGHRRLPGQSYSRQHLPRGQTLMGRVWQWELARLACGRCIPCGTSCLAVAELSSYQPKVFSNVNQ